MCHIYNKSSCILYENLTERIVRSIALGCKKVKRGGEKKNVEECALSVGSIERRAATSDG
jgi:hypothetical protein